ncbi:MAG: hypothetical protein CVV64_03125 [Candidatus Wallbacteria bacterium HGW-Wallbacteria-1]|jgi:signal transduction histidine kinase/DNA-binding response OmpR family regulator|uniref:histidine kinase n=1 Tax=Candidatus Wallbacteria bacterium HGW-Wallbacteria-1 TaxID=2013854 RepID=A0A2N1PTS4_9BACT|nr:MAG: hypothetical protein CVV64_03125 [Candidatus Wallbacteria bacterium HGW-Wallbacteria-1]
MARNLRFLIVDDREEIVSLISEIIVMVDSSAAVECAYDGIQALETASRFRPDIVILDIYMPRMTGYQVCRLLKEDPCFGDVKVIMLTGTSVRLARFRGLKSGADKFVTKPFNFDQFKDVLGEVVRDKRENLEADDLKMEDSEIRQLDSASILAKVNDLLDQRIHELTVVNELVRAIRTDMSEEKVREVFLRGTLELFDLRSVAFLECRSDAGNGSGYRNCWYISKWQGDDNIGEIQLRGNCALSDFTVSGEMTDLRYCDSDLDSLVGFPIDGEKERNGNSDTCTGLLDLAEQLKGKTRMVFDYAVPVVARGTILGTVFIETMNKKSDTGRWSSSLTVLLNQLGIGLDNIQLYRELKQKVVNLAKANSELGRTNKELTETREQLIRSEKFVAMGKLAGGIAHEINNPLGVISTCVQSLMMSSDLHEEIMEDLNMIKSETERAARIVQRILESAIKMPITFHEVDVRETIRSTVQSVQIIPDARNIHFELDFPDEDLIIMAGDEQFRSIIVNLLTNAVHGINSGDNMKCGRIVVRAFRDESSKKLCIEINDNGCGIPEENILRVFDPFFSTKDVGKGIGLGLTLTYNAVKSFKGDISVKSSLDNGTTFKLVFP